METSLPSPKPQESLFCHGAKIVAAETPPDQAKASRMQNQQGYEGRTRMERSHGKPIDRRENGIPLRDLRVLCGSNLRSDFDSLAGKRNQPRRNETSHHGMVPCPPNRQRLKTRSLFGPVPQLHPPVPGQRQSGLQARNWVRSASKKPKPSDVIWADPVSAVHHHTVTTIFPTCWFDSR